MAVSNTLFLTWWEFQHTKLSEVDHRIFNRIRSKFRKFFKSKIDQFIEKILDMTIEEIAGNMFVDIMDCFLLVIN